MKPYAQPSAVMTFLLAAALGVWMGACNCGGVPPGTEDGGGQEDGATTPTDGAVQTDLDGSVCLGNGQSCSAGGTACCAGTCDNGTCKALCQQQGQTCTDSSQCCGGIQCNGGTCSGPKCTDLGGGCTAGSQCCTGVCGAGTDGGMACQNVPGSGTCKKLGSTCGTGGECCSSLCRFGACALAAACRAYNEVCYAGADCCSGLCSRTDGGPGFCITPTGGPGCDQSGVPCSSGTNCCTKVCADLGTGATVCQPVGGCRVAGDFCPATAACCGSVTSSVACSNELKCNNGTACRAAGTICGKPVYLDGGEVRRPDGTVFTVNNETNCCDGFKVMGKEQTCRMDSAGVPRCFGGGSGLCPFGYTGQPGCCIAQGNACDIKDACCDGALCLAGADGGRICQKPVCAGIGATCLDSSTCCAGTECLSTGELGGLKACQLPPKPNTLPDGGTAPADAGTCRSNTSVCSAGSQCCSGICTNGVCAGQAACSGADAGCSGPGDCCVGLSCNIPSGATAGKCTPGATCSGLGQTCNASTACCTGTACKTSVGAACDGTSACTCQVQIN